MLMNGVFDKVTGALLRKGFVDFENSPSADPINEDYRSDVETAHIRKLTNNGDFTTWNGSTYETTTRSQKGSKPREKIMYEILTTAEPATQLDRLLSGLDVNGSIIAALDNSNYPLASSRLTKAVTAGQITQADQDLVENTFPDGWDS